MGEEDRGEEGRMGEEEDRGEVDRGEGDGGGGGGERMRRRRGKINNKMNHVFSVL